jgi:NitT/TauT family transport system substrate-binding protein
MIPLDRIGLILRLPPAEAQMLFAQGYGAAIEVADTQAIPLLTDNGYESLIEWPTEIGSIPESVYYTTHDVIATRRSEVVALTRALTRALEWIRQHAADEIAAELARFAPTLPHKPTEAGIAHLVGAYTRQRMWERGPAVDPDGVRQWTSMLIEAHWLSQSVSYEAVVDSLVVQDATAPGQSKRVAQL